MIYYTCKHFKIYELVDSQTYDRFGEQAWMFFRPEALISLDGIREYFDKPVIVNNWKWGGDLSFRGIRPSWYQAVKGEYSQHRFGNAFDLQVKGFIAEEIRQTILQNKQDERFKYITCLETDITWVHFDCRNITERILILKPH